MRHIIFQRRILQGIPWYGWSFFGLFDEVKSKISEMKKKRSPSSRPAEHTPADERNSFQIHRPVYAYRVCRRYASLRAKNVIRRAHDKTFLGVVKRGGHTLRATPLRAAPHRVSDTYIYYACARARTLAFGVNENIMTASSALRRPFHYS